jgi:S1-C subfamily serine protease
MLTWFRGGGSALLALTSFLLLPRPGAAQVPDELSETSLEALVERVTRAVVLIDVRTASDSRQGSGFLIDSSGRLLTNYHVVRDARSARVKLSSGDAYERVTILAQDERRDIAVLQIPGFDLPTLPMGNSDSVRIGAPVVLVGSPLGLENTVSTGIVSGRRQEPEGFQLLQITAPASQGSSGGAVLSANGEVVGIAASQIRSGQNLNFAVPINYARGLLQNLDTSPVVLAPTSDRRSTGDVEPMSGEDETVNRGLSYDLSGFEGYVVESARTLGGGMSRRTRITLRVIETVGGSPPRVERYMESVTTQSTEPFGTEQTVRRERTRSLVSLDGLRPLSSTGDIAWWTEDGWRRAEHELRFDGDRVVGVVSDSTGSGMEIDRTLPRGTLLRDHRDLAFGTLAVDSLVGRSVELSTFDAWTGRVERDRYDVMGRDTIEVAGVRRPVLRTNVATGLTNETSFFLEARPRIAVRTIGQDGSQREEATFLEVLGESRPPRSR